MKAIEPFDPRTTYLSLLDSGESAVGQAEGPPPEVVGFSVGVATMSEPPPHLGECHLDGDEALYLIRGRAEIVLELPDATRSVELTEGQAFVVPKAVWHRVLPKGEVELLYITPGPNNQHRPLDG